MKKITKYKLILVSAFLILGPLMLTGVGILSNNQTTCIFDTLGGKCFGCNIRAALFQLRRGNMLEAFRLNPLVYVWIIIAISIVLSELYMVIRKIINRQYDKESLLDWIIKKMFKDITF